MVLVFDTETTTFPSPSLPATHPDQARIVQLAWLLLDDELKEVGCFNSLIKIPDGVRISEGAAKAHGISEDMCRKYGVPIESALQPFLDILNGCGSLVAHNVTFDLQLVDIEHGILFNSNAPLAIEQFCTMRTMTPICRLPHKSGRRLGSQYKWPTLQEAHTYCFGNQFDGAHDALADVRATAAVYKWLKNRERVLNMKPTSEPLCQTTITQNT